MKLILSTCAALATLAAPALTQEISVGPRPGFLVSQMKDGPLKEKLASCLNMPMERKLFSIAHRGAPLQFPEHTVEGHTAGAQMGAGILECDVTFTKDKQLVCRHAQNDLHTSTNILATELASNCTKPFTPAEGDVEASAECRASDVTLAEFRTLRGKMDGANLKATTVEEYMAGTAPYRTDLYADQAGTLMSHADSIALIKSFGAKFTPELKEATVEMPYEGVTQANYAQMMIDEYRAAGIPPSDVWAQSFNLDDIRYWIENEPEFGKQAVFLDDRDETAGLDPMNPETFKPSMQELADMGVVYLAPSLWMMVTLADGKIVPSPYAEAAKAAGLKLIGWSLERSGPLVDGGGYYYQSIKDVTNSDGVMYELVDVLAQRVGVSGLFSDWPATVTFYANCMGLD